MASIKFFPLSLVAIFVTCVYGLNDESLLNFSVEPTENVYAVRKKDFTWNCEARGSQPINISWEKDGTAIVDNPRRHVLSNGSLYFTSVGGRRHLNPDEGNYACIIRNDHGAIRSRTVSFTVSRMGKITLRPYIRTSLEGDNVRFECLVEDALPSANITWYKNRKLVNKENDRYVFLPSGVLQVHSVRKEDEGLYRCNAEIFSRRRGSHEAALTVVTKDKQPTLNQQAQHLIVPINGSQNYITAIATESAYLECIVKRKEENIAVQWYDGQGGEEIRVSPRKSFIKDNLIITDVRPIDSGYYICAVADKNLNKIIGQINYFLKVHEPPTFIFKPRSVKRPIGFNVGFSCSVRGYPEPEIRWYHNGKLVQFGNSTEYRIRIYQEHSLNSRIVIKDTTREDHGFYQCMASNSCGSVSAIATLTSFVGITVNPPTNLTATPLTSTEVLLKWRAPNSSERDVVVTYSLNYYFEDEGSMVKRTRLITPAYGQDTMAYLLEDLSPFKNYSFSVVAYSNNEKSEESETIHITTLEDVPYDSPKLTLNNDNWHTIRITWERVPEEFRNGEIISYCIYFTSELEYRYDGTINSIELDEGTFSYDLTGLQPGIEYYVSISAATRVGYGVQSEWKIIRTGESTSTQ